MVVQCGSAREENGTYEVYEYESTVVRKQEPGARCEDNYIQQIYRVYDIHLHQNRSVSVEVFVRAGPKVLQTLTFFLTLV